MFAETSLVWWVFILIYLCKKNWRLDSYLLVAGIFWPFEKNAYCFVSTTYGLFVILWEHPPLLFILCKTVKWFSVVVHHMWGFGVCKVPIWTTWFFTHRFRKGTSGSSLGLCRETKYLYLCRFRVCIRHLASVLAVGESWVLGKHSILRLCGVLFIGLLECFRLQNLTILPICFAEKNVRFKFESLST